MCLLWHGSVVRTAAVGSPRHTAVGRQPVMEGASAGRAAVLGGRGLTRRLLPAVVGPQPAGAVLVLVLGVRCRAEQSAGLAPLLAQPRAEHRRMTLLISPAQKYGAQGILMDL